jgi:hypothetical protein
MVCTALSSLGLVPNWNARASPFTHVPSHFLHPQPLIFFEILNSHAKNLLLAHGYAVDLYRREYQPKQGGQIGITLVSFLHTAWFLY